MRKNISTIENRRDLRMEKFCEYLIQDEMSQGTIEEYTRNIISYYEWMEKSEIGGIALGNEEIKRSVLEYKKALQIRNLAATTINAKLAALNKYLAFRGIEFKLKYLKVQRKLFKETEKNLNKNEYDRLIDIAHKRKKERIALIMETLCATGMRVSELKYVTMETLYKPTIEISMKGKVRIIIIPKKMKEKLKEYALNNNIGRGEIFVTSTGKSISRNQIWREMKALCRLTDIEESKVFPHNIRALFARLYYEESKDIIRLSDLLGHSNINTTRIYLKVPMSEIVRQIERMNIVA